MSHKKSKLEAIGTARPRTASAQFLNNKHFAYLLDENKDTETDEATTPLTSPTLKITAALRNGAKNTNKNRKDRFKKPRTSSIQVDTTRNQNEQLNAIKKEVEYLQKEVPHFDKIYHDTQQQWISSKRNAADVEAFALIQGLTEWIHTYGNHAVKQYDEFKKSAESEILSMVHKMEKLTHENTKFNLLIQEADVQKEDFTKKIEMQERDIAAYKKKEEETAEDLATTKLNNNTLRDLEAELLSIREKNKTYEEKYLRVEKYWKMTQDENDELRNRNYGMDQEIHSLKNVLKQNKENISQINIKHQKTLQNLQTEHQSYAQQMRHEQEKLIAAQHQARDSAVIQGSGTGYTIHADDSDIGGSGITDDNDEYMQDGIVSLENEINVYEYEDDEWLNETDSDYDDNAPEPFSSSESEPEEEEYNKQIEFETIKESHCQDIVYQDISKGFQTMKMTFGQDSTAKTNAFEMATQKMSQANERQMETKEDLSFSSERMKIEVEAKKQSLGLTMSSTETSHTPQLSGPMDDFASSITKSEEIAKPQNMEFSASATGAMGQTNEMIHKHNIPKPLKRVIYIERGAKKDDKMIMGGRNFAERLAMFKHFDDTRGGKPQILEQAKAFSLVHTWNKQHPKNTVLQNIKKGECHVTKSTVHSIGDSARRGQTVNVLKITKTKSHTLKPRLFGYMNIIRSSFIPRWKATQKPRYFFVLDGLPSETNINHKEPDFAKNRQHDFLVPTLFFFQDKDDYDSFYEQVKKMTTRDVQFQKLFAKYAKGTFALNQFAMEINVSNCMRRVNRLQKKNDIKLPMSEINGCGQVNDLTILLCNDKEIHRFSCNDKFSRNKWVKKVNKLVDRRAKRLININNGFLGVPQQSASRPSIPGVIGSDDDMMNTPVSPAGFIGSPGLTQHPYDTNILFGKANRASMYKLTNIKAVEKDFD